MADHRLMTVPNQTGSTARSQLPAHGTAAPRRPASVDPAALPGNGARVVSRPAGSTGTETKDPEQEDTARGH